MLERRWLLLTIYGILLASTVSEALKGARTKFKIATTTTTTTTEEPKNEENDNSEATTLSTDVNATTGHTLTGIPQIDYIWDPNLPRELNGYNLSEYPFYNSIPEEIDFKCDGLHDGFYASVPHKCQVYHHCLYGTRYDFLCANFTAFDQKTFICHFASEVDCANSKKYWHRNDALYKAATTTPPPTQSTTTTTTTTARPTSSVPPVDAARPTRRRRPLRRRPAYDYYDDDYYDDEYERPRGRGSYDRRDEYDYDDRKYMRRDRERDREFRDRERDYRDREAPRREAERSERPPRDERDPSIGARDRFHMRNNRRDPPRPLRDPDDEEVRSIRGRDEDPEEERRGDDRRYEKIPIKDDYDEEPPTAPSGSSIGDSLVKPAAPIASVYARPRAPPKIRRPVPISEQDRFAYKATSVQPPAADSRKRPTESPLIDDEYYDEELEEVRPRRPMRPRRPYRERERTFYDPPRENRERERDRPFRSRYRDDDEERPRKYPERSRDRYYERSRDRSLDRGKERTPERDSRPVSRRPIEKEEKSHPLPRGKDVEPPEDSRKPLPKVQETTTTSTPPPKPSEPEKQYEDEDYISKPASEKPVPVKADNKKPEEEYTDDYYDEPEGPPSSPAPRTAVRIVKRPFLPSRGGNPNPRGLSPVGTKAPDARKSLEKSVDDKVKVEDNQKRREFERGSVRRPEDTQVIAPEEDESERKPEIPWNAEELPRGSDNSNNFGSTYASEAIRESPSGPGKQRVNEVPHRLQDIPESEYDVTLNEALTPGFNQESSLPSGFVLPLHRQLNREPVIQSSENNYKISRPYVQGNQKPFVPSPQFVPVTRISGNERSGSVQYFRTPETVNSGNQYRQTSRSSWHDYGGY